ncbi:MAG: hypothetical protein ABI383_08070 [Acidobacteriaceae bacterium]
MSSCAAAAQDLCNFFASSKSFMFNKMLLVIFVIALSAIGYAAQPGGILYASGNATVNEAAVNRSTVFYPGDRIATGAGSAVIVSSADNISLPADTSLMLRNGILHLGCGGAFVKTSDRIQAKIGDLLITPDSHNAQYRLNASRGNINVTAVSGSFKVSQGNHYTRLASGKALNLQSDCSAGSAFQPAADALPIAATEAAIGTVTPADSLPSTRTSPLALWTVGSSSAAVVITTIVAASVSPIK